MFQNKLNVMASWTKCIYSFHRHVLTYDNQGHRIGPHKKKNPSGFEGYIRKIFLFCHFRVSFISVPSACPSFDRKVESCPRGVGIAMALRAGQPLGIKNPQ